MDGFISGGISGAISNPYSKEALKHAEVAYGSIRKSHTDIERIANNTEYTKEQITLIKNYLFYDEHDLDGEYRRFDPDFCIAQSWHRLAFEPDNIQEHDLILLKHELHEMQLMLQGYKQSEAHDLTNGKGLNYHFACERYYETISGHASGQGKDINSGAINSTATRYYNPDDDLGL